MSIYANIYRFWALLPVYIKFSWPDQTRPDQTRPDQTRPSLLQTPFNSSAMLFVRIYCCTFVLLQFCTFAQFHHDSGHKLVNSGWLPGQEIWHQLWYVATAVKLQIQCWHEIVNARKGANSLGGMSQDLKTNMVQKMDVCFWNFTIRSLVVELLARARKGRACVHTRNGANSLGGMSQH